MENETVISKNATPRTWMPTAAGITSIISGIAGFGIAWRLWFVLLRPIEAGEAYYMLDYIFAALTCLAVLTGIFSIIGGIFALQRRKWKLSLFAAISPILVSNWITSMIPVIFLVLSRKEFN
jgi:hypothetical protein